MYRSHHSGAWRYAKRGVLGLRVLSAAPDMFVAIPASIFFLSVADSSIHCLVRIPTAYLGLWPLIKFQTRGLLPLHIPCIMQLYILTKCPTGETIERLASRP